MLRLMKHLMEKCENKYKTAANEVFEKINEDL